MKTLPPLESRVRRLLSRLKSLYPDAATDLQHQTPLQLLVSVILSAQCTDARVNMVTPALFARFKTARDFADAEPEEIEKFIFSTGFYRNKAKNIRAACRVIVEKHGGEVPGTLEDLILLPGIGRKTANCILGDAFDTPGITVDTHVGRLSRRLGLTAQKDPVKVEADLMKLIPRPQWTPFSHRLIWHGRRVCHSRKPDCGRCKLIDICPQVGVLPAGPEPAT